MKGLSKFLFNQFDVFIPTTKEGKFVFSFNWKQNTDYVINNFYTNSYGNQFRESR